MYFYSWQDNLLLYYFLSTFSSQFPLFNDVYNVHGLYSHANKYTFIIT